MTNKLSKEQRIKSFTQRIIKFAREQIELGRNYGWSEDTIAKDLQFLIDYEITRAREDERNKVKEYLKEHSITARITIPDTYVVDAEKLMEKLNKK